jgi:chemotaxis protein MotB
MAGKGGGAWKVAYADFVTAMMAFFLVMWLVGQNEKVKEAIAQEFSAPTSNRKSRPPKPKKYPVPVEPAPKAPSGPPAESTLDVKQRVLANRKFNPTHSATLVFFAENSAQLDDEGKDRLKRLVPWIAGKPQKIEIRGHASRRPLPPGGEFSDPWQLCYARCRAAASFLEQQGISPERVRISQAAGYEPYSARVEPQWQARNSRVEVALLSELVDEFEAPDSQPSEQVSLAP